MSPSETTTYTLTATDPQGEPTLTDSVTIAVADAKPTVTFGADSESIVYGESAVLTWTSTHADSCVIEPGMGQVDLSGSVTVSPTETTTYRITASGPGGAATDAVRIFATDPQGYRYGNPTPEEQAHLEAINRARANPTAEAARLGIELNEGLEPGTISGDPVQPLTFNARIHQAAALHSLDMTEQDYYAHDSLDGRTSGDRMQEAGYDYSRAAENIGATYDYEPIDELANMLVYHDRLFVDENTPGRGHRLNILNVHLKEAGLGAAFGACTGYPYCSKFTCDFGSSNDNPNPFLLGVVYDDENENGAYDAYEGVGNVQIQVVEAGLQTSTASAGGYGLQVPSGNYLIRAVMPDGRESEKQVGISDWNVKVDFLPGDFDQPIARLSADPQTIQIGGSSTLTWSSANAESCSIDQGVGNVGVTGSISVSPTETTTYTITASGPGGTATANVTVTVTATYPEPTVSLSADPETINSGEFSTLSWTSSYADTYSIEPDIGSIDPSGSTTVSPTETTVYTITATGPGGTTTDSATITVISSISLQITSPLDAAAISTSDTLVQGTITNITGSEKGVTVNGVVALVSDNQFAANHIPLEYGENIITAHVTDTDGHTASTSITVYSELHDDYINITAYPESGVSPLETKIRIDSSFNLPEEFTFICNGPASGTYHLNTSEFDFILPTEGVYYLTAEVDYHGSTYTDTVAVLAMDETNLDALLKAKWDGMRQALGNGDINGSIKYIAEDKKEMYEYNLNLMSSYISEISAGLQDIQLVQIKEGKAEYEMWAEQDGRTFSFYMVFARDKDGIWRIEFF